MSSPSVSTRSNQAVSDAVRDHSQFFDRLVNLVPARYYHNDDTPHQSLKYMKKNAREAEKAKRKLQAKAAKRAKLNPDTAQTALDMQQKGMVKPIVNNEDNEAEQQTHEAPASQAADGKGAQSIGSGAKSGKSILLKGHSGSQASMDELRARLQTRLQDLREKRRVEERKKHAEEASKWREKSLRAKKSAAQQASKKRKAGKDAQNTAGQPPKHSSEPAADLTFGQLTFGQGEERPKKKGKGLGTAELLRDAERRAAEREQLAASAEGQAQLGKSAWSSAFSRARGEKILDDPKLLRKSLKKEQKEKEKKSAAWKERQQRQKKEGRDRQKKRRDNLQARVTAKQQKKKQAREKKLMRPGFEGRRDSFINEAN